MRATNCWLFNQKVLKGKFRVGSADSRLRPDFYLERPYKNRFLRLSALLIKGRMGEKSRAKSTE